MKQQLLSDNWENAYLNEALHNSLMYLRQPKPNSTAQEFNESEYFRTTPVFLIDHPTLNKYNADVLIVNNSDNEKQKNMIFIFKEGLVKELNKYQLPDSEDVAHKITEYIHKSGINAMNAENDNNVIISKDVFIELLKSANLENIVKTLSLEQKSSTKPKM